MCSLLLHHLEHLVHHFRITDVTDFDTADCILYFDNDFESIKKEIGRVAGIQLVRTRSNPSSASYFIQALLKMRPQWGINIFFSRLGPFYFTTVETPEAMKPLRMALIYKNGLGGEPRWDAYVRSKRRQIPEKVSLAIKALDGQLAACGFLRIPEKILRETPSTGKRIPRRLRSLTFEFFYFESVNLNARPQPK